jgi:hypothetical protein
MKKLKLCLIALIVVATLGSCSKSFISLFVIVNNTGQAVTLSRYYNSANTGATPVYNFIEEIKIENTKNWNKIASSGNGTCSNADNYILFTERDSVAVIIPNSPSKVFKGNIKDNALWVKNESEIDNRNKNCTSTFTITSAMFQ